MSGETVVMSEFERQMFSAAGQAISLMGDIAVDAALQTGTLAVSGAWLGAKYAALVCGKVASEISGAAEQERRDARKRAEATLYARRQAVMEQIERDGRTTGLAVRKARIAAESEKSHRHDASEVTCIRSDLKERIDVIAERLSRIPPDRKRAIGRGIHSLEKHLKELRNRLKHGEPLADREIDGLASSLQSLMSVGEKTEAIRQRIIPEFHEKILEIFAEISEFREIQPPAETYDEIDGIDYALDLLLKSSDPDPARLAVLAETWVCLKQKLVSFIQIKAYRRKLAESSKAHLIASGYELLVDFPDDIGQQAGDAFFSIPGGETLRVHLDEACRLRFLVLHTKSGKETEFSLKHFRAFQAQENKFCGDLPAVLDGLQKEGFILKISSEKKVAEENIETVKVETADEIRQKSHERKSARISYFRKKKEKRYLPC